MANLSIETNSGVFDLYDSEKIVQTISVFNFSDLTLRAGEFTNTFKLPTTSNNLQLIKYANSVLTVNTGVYEKIECSIVVDSVVIRNGFLSVDSVGENILANFYSGNTVFYDLIKNKNLPDFEWSDFNHAWNYTNAVAKSNASSGYVYPLINYGYQNLASDIIDVRQILPSTYAKEILNRIVTQLRYTANYNFDTSDFDTVILPYAKKNPEISNEIRLLNQVDLGNFNDYSINGLPTYVHYGARTNPFFVSTGGLDINGVPTPYDARMDISYNKINTAGSSTLYDFVENIFTPQYAGTYDFDFTCELLDYDYMSFVFSPVVASFNMNTNTRLCVYKVDASGARVQQLANTIANTGILSGTSTTVVPAIPQTFITNTVNGSVYLEVGERLEACLEYTFFGSYSQSANVKTQLTGNFTPTVRSLTYLKVDLQPTLVFNGLITYKSMLPKIKASEFLKDLCIRFGLILNINELTKTIDINILDKVKSNIPNAKDWSDKLDLTKKPQLLFKYDSYAQINNIKHKDDKSVQETPIGSDYQLLIVNSNLENEKDLYVSPFGVSEQCVFTVPTPDVSTLLIRLYDNVSNRFNKDVQLRIAYCESVTGKFKYTDGTTTSGYIDVKRVWFVDNSKPDKSMGFGFNLIDKYSNTLINTLTNIKIVKCSVYLNLIDILTYDFFTPVYIEHFDSYFIVSNINQYDYTNEGTTEVELIKLN
jgi:hypothetical protein